MLRTYPPEALLYTRRRRAVLAWRLLILAALWAALVAALCAPPIAL